MPERQGFLPTMVRVYTKKEMGKPLFGKPSIKYGQTFGIAGFMFQLGGMLGATFHDNLIPFMTVYNGTTNLDKSIASVQGNMLEEVFQYGDEVKTLNEFVIAHENKRWNIPPDALGSIAVYGTKKMPEDIAFFIPWELGMFGASLGLMKPDIYRQWFDTNYQVDAAAWKRARDAGLAIPAEPDAVTYAQSEQDALDMFIPFAGEFFPEFKDVLTRKNPPVAE